MKWLLRGGMLYDGYRLMRQDVLLDNDRVAEVAGDLSSGGAQVLEATGLVISPAFTDLHTHLRQPGYPQKETIATGTAAAAAGGFATVCAMPNLAPAPDCPDTLAPQQKEIEAGAVVEVLPYGCLTQGQHGRAAAEIAALAPHVVGYSDDGFDVQNEEVLRDAMRQAAAANRFVAAHCEDASLISPGAVCVQHGSCFARAQGITGYAGESEWRAVQRNIRLAAETGCRLHICHASTRETFALVRKAKQSGLAVTCEVTPHNLLLSCNDIQENSGRYKMNPPLRTPADVRAARQALADGTVDAVATDHAPHTKEDKEGGFLASASGVAGLETAFAAVYTGLVQPGILSLEQLLALLTWRPRGVCQQPPRPLRPGQVANLVLLDVTMVRKVDPEGFCSKGRSTPFAQKVLCGWPVMTFYRGEVVYQRKNGN